MLRKVWVNPMKQTNRLGLRRSWHKTLRTGARPGGEEGAALYELALVTPFLSMLLVGILWGGMTFYDYVVLADAVAAGARTLATGSADNITTQNPCQLAQATVQSATHNLNQTNLNVPLPTLTGAGGSTCSTLVANDTGIVWATYSCNLPISFSSMNLCPLAQGAKISVTLQNSQSGPLQLGTCQYAHCISAITTVLIE